MSDAQWIAAPFVLAFVLFGALWIAAQVTKR